jgi:hypothetical protein
MRKWLALKLAKSSLFSAEQEGTYQHTTRSCMCGPHNVATQLDQK